jgi:hypothetical protein
VRLFFKTGATVYGLGEIVEVIGAERCKLRLLTIYKKAAKLFTNTAGKDKKLGDFELGDIVEWSRRSLRLASMEEIAKIAQQPPAGAAKQVTHSRAAAAQPTQAEIENVDLPEGVNIEDYPNSHHDESQTNSRAEDPMRPNPSSPARPVTDKQQHFHVRIKLDIFHAKKRLTDTVKKTHGCYKYFCELMSDAFFVTSP